MRDKTVGLLLVTYQSAEDLPGFLATLEAAVEPLAVDVVCVDNTSTDNGPDLVEDFGGTVIRNERNIGLAAAINQAAAQTDAEWLLVANPDTQLSPGSISRLVETAMSDERIGMIGPRIARLDGTAYPSGRRFPSLLVGTAHALLGGGLAGHPGPPPVQGPPVDDPGNHVGGVSGWGEVFCPAARL
ncbi:glycosyltransferase, partial [Nocardia cyriacigeorgica]|uniref:glycosyltransferase n=1 Tax=Nocardia cyriacigeorgica TaxID=135487 RepID=UPI002458B503